MKSMSYSAPFAALMLMAAAPAAGSESAGGGSDASAPASAKKICKRFENSGSRMKSTKLCLTREEWKKWQAQEDQAG